ncbi:hypothetical protein BGX34_008162 [Mortierella sp. NVP85]|nr:hypothetical protein BGX34_008162 [Mortierella sp. NVP85]
MPIFKTFDLERQSVEMPGTRTPGATGHYRHAAFADKLVDHIRDAPHVKTLYDLFQHSLSEYSERDFLGHRPYDSATQTYGGYTWQTFSQINQRINAFGSGIMHLNEHVLGSTQLTRWTLGIWAQGRPEWCISEMSCNFYNLISVALYDTLGADSIEYVCNHAEIRMVVCSANHVASLLENRDKMPQLKVVISMDPLRDNVPVAGSPKDSSKELRAWGDKIGIKVYDFDEVEALGKKFPRKHIPPQSEEVASICYTSGTTGAPKGAMLTHRNFVASVGTTREGVRLSPDDVIIGYLPLAHIMGRMIETHAMLGGSRIGYFRGDVNLLMEDINELKPTYFPTVPRLLNRIYAKIVAATIEAPGAAGEVSRRAVAEKLANLQAGKGVHHPHWDKVVFEKIRNTLGGRVQVLLTGSAPISKEVLNLLRIAFSCVVTEGYGSTESMACTTVTMADEYIPGHVGSPRSGVEIRLVDVPEMNYFSTDKPYPRGEIQVRSAGVFKGYYKDEEKTREAVDPEGWLATGDIGFMDHRGCLTIVDRKKNIFKLAQGEYIAPERIENILTARCNLIMQIYIHGDSLESTLVAVSIPDPETFLPFANAIAGTQVKPGDGKGLLGLCQDAKVRAAYLKELEIAGKAGGLKGFELAKRVHLTLDVFSVDNDMVTPTGKVRRPQVRDYFKEQIRVMYDEIHHDVPAARL